MNDLRTQIDRMMRWAAVAYYPWAAFVLVSVSAASARADADEEPATAETALALVAAVTAAATLVCWAAALWQIFRTGRRAFGTWSGLVYAGLAVVLSPWPGLYVVPHMVRLDVKRLLGVEPAVPGTDAAAEDRPCQADA